MRFLSVCSGIEAVSVATEPLGWKAIGFSEIETFPCSVLAHHYPNVRNYGDMTRFEEWDINETDFDLLAGGTPCQDLSQGGLGKGWNGTRSGLAWSFIGIAKKFRPKWILWENVVGSIRGKNRRGFIRFASEIAELGYCFSWRVLDARYFGCAQRRPRVFAVASLGNQRSEQVLLESEGIIGTDTSPAPPTVSVCLTARGAGSLDDRETYVRDERGVRHLTPLEHERLMGFPDNYTLVTHRNKPACDGPRYKAIGNSMAVPVIRWICQRIQEND